MKISIIGWHSFLEPIANNLEKKGHIIYFNQFSKHVDLILVQSHCHYKIYKFLKEIKKKKIKIINIILDIPVFRLQKDFCENSLLKSFQQACFNITQKYRFINKKIKKLKARAKISKIHKLIFKFVKPSFNTGYSNRIYYQINYRNYLKHADLNLSISKFTQKTVKRFLKVDSKVWYIGVNSDILLSLPKSNKIEYDAINISKILWWKRQDIFIKAAKILGLKILIIGPHVHKSITLNCQHYELSDHISVFKKLNESKFYVDASIFEGFGMTPIEAAFLDKITIASDTYVHKEILEDYPLYFKRNNVEDLVEKMKMVIKGEFSPSKEAIEKIKKKYSLEASTSKLLEYIESLF